MLSDIYFAMPLFSIAAAAFFLADISFAAAY